MSRLQSVLGFVMACGIVAYARHAAMAQDVIPPLDQPAKQTSVETIKRGGTTTTTREVRLHE